MGSYPSEDSFELRLAYLSMYKDNASTAISLLPNASIISSYKSFGKRNSHLTVFIDINIGWEIATKDILCDIT